MRPVRLSGTLDGAEVFVWACGKCRVALLTEALALACCGPAKCKDCGGGVERYHQRCAECVNKWHLDAARKRVDAAPKVDLSDYRHDMVLFDGADRGTTVDDWLNMDADEQPPWAWAVTHRGVPQLDATDIIDNLLCDHHEEAAEDLDVGSLQFALDTWHAEQSVNWWVGDGRIVELPS